MQVLRVRLDVFAKKAIICPAAPRQMTTTIISTKKLAILSVTRLACKCGMARAPKIIEVISGSGWNDAAAVVSTKGVELQLMVSHGMIFQIKPKGLPSR